MGEAGPVRAKKIPETLSCLLLFDKATGRWTGHCLDFDIATSGKTQDAAWEHLRIVVKTHVERCWRSRPEALGRSARAPKEDWDLFQHLNLQQSPARTDKITFDLAERELIEECGPLWVKALEFTQGPECEQAATSVSPVH